MSDTDKKDKYKGPTAQKIKTQADIVFCIDVTGSMKPCIEGVINGIATLVEGINSAAQVDFQLRLIAYRDKHDLNHAHEPWSIHPFTSSVDTFRAQLSQLVAFGGGDAPESTLDALFLALHSDWRPHKTHKTIILLTDADSHPKLHSTTWNQPLNDVRKIIQDFQELDHVMLFMVTPAFPIYQEIERGMNNARRQIIAKFVPQVSEQHKGLKSVNFNQLMQMIGKTVSLTSIVVAQGEE